MVSRKLLLVAGLVLGGSSPALFADATLELKSKSGDSSTFQASDGIGKMSMPGGGGYIVYNTETRTMVYADTGRGEYMSMTEAEMDSMIKQAVEMRKQMAPQMQAMKKQLAGLDPQMRKMIEERMGVSMAAAEGASAAPASPELVEQGGKTIAGLKCQQYKVLQSGKPVADACLLTSANGKLSKKDFETLAETFGFFRRMATRSGMLSGKPGAIMSADFKGVPISVTDSTSGENYVLVNVHDNTLPKNLFTEYQRLKKVQMPFMTQ